MSSPGREDLAGPSALNDEDDPMRGSEQEEEGEDVGMRDAIDDSSEEEEEDEEEERRIRQGFIVDEEEEEEEEEEEVETKPRKRRKKHHRGELEEDDLDLLEENTGGRFKRSTNRLSRLRHRRSESPEAASSSKRRAVVESSEDDLDQQGDNREVPDLAKIWDDDRRGDDDDLDDFIEYSEEEEGAMNEEARSARREEKRQEAKRKRARVRPELAGIDANAWDEIHEVFGDGHDYDWALVGDDEAEMEEEQYKPELKVQDVFEPSEIKKRMLTDDDDLIRAMDIPERMQLASCSLSDTSTLSLHTQLTEDDLGGAAMWVTSRLPEEKTQEFFSPDGKYTDLKSSLVMAVTFALRQLFLEEYEVPYIWVHKRDYITHFDVQNVQNRVELLSVDDLWRINTLGQKYRSLLERKKAIAASYQKLDVQDSYYENVIEPLMESPEVVTDATEWLSMKYKAKQQEGGPEFRFHDDEEMEVDKKRKMPSRVSAYEVAKKSIIAKLAEKYGIQAPQVVQNFLEGHHVHFVEDTDVNPMACAEQFVDPDPKKAQPPEELLRRARLILSTELGKDPALRAHIRKLYREEARFSVEPTDRGISKIDERHPYYNFKYLKQKPLQEMLKSGQFLHILAAESELLVTVTVTIPPDVKMMFERKLADAISSDNFAEAAKEWNSERNLVIQEALEHHLIPIGVKWAREILRDEVEDFLAFECNQKFKTRIDKASFTDGELRYGEFATSVLAISWGKGDPHKDAITLVYVDELGRVREHTKIDNLFDQDNLDEFIDLLNRRKPGVAVIGGYSVATLKLMQRVKEVFQNGGGGMEQDNRNHMTFQIPAIYVQDDVARLYQHSKRAADEFSALSPTAKYCVGLARYVQSPLNEFAALGKDISAITFDEDNQNLIPKEKLLYALEQALVDVTNKVGVEINRAVSDPYYQHILPFVCGLGPRKAEMLAKKISSQGGMLANRDQFIKGGLLTTKIFLNAAGFLRIIQQAASKRHSHDDDAQDPLDDTRIHPEDYELARKMAMDALELDEEDIANEHPSHVVTLLMGDKERDRKLLELNLDEFAISLYEANHDQKRHTLNLIRDELSRPFAEIRPSWTPPTNWEILTMLTGETPRTLMVTLIITAQVYRVTKEEVYVKLPSGIDGYIKAKNLSERGDNPHNLVKKGQTITAVVVELLGAHPGGDIDSFCVELSSKPDHLKEGSTDVFRSIRHDDYWDDQRYDRDKDMLARRKRAENDKSRRVIKHPNFHNFNTAQAEVYLEKQQRGDVVIRPSSKGSDHLAVTWKVDDKLYQHIDVTELNNTDPTGTNVGGTLIVDRDHLYSDLDELIVNHIQAMGRRVEELMAHEKFKHGTEDDLHIFLKNYLTANPSKSMYGFTLNRKRPGHFNLCFLANKNSNVQTWPVRVTPEAYYLFDAPAVGVPELCDAFKVRHLHESQNFAAAAAAAGGGKTPFGAGRTPRHGGATPGHMSVRQVGRTPNPYSGGQTPFQPPHPPQNYGHPPPHPAAPYGYQTPRAPPFPGQPPQLPPNMNPPHAPPVWGGPQRWP